MSVWFTLLGAERSADQNAYHMSNELADRQSTLAAPSSVAVETDPWRWQLYDHSQPCRHSSGPCRSPWALSAR